MAPISGGNWYTSADAGVWAFNLNNNRTNSNNNIGFRSDSVSPHIGQPKSGTKGDVFRQLTAAKSVHCHLSSSGLSRAFDRQVAGL